MKMHPEQKEDETFVGNALADGTDFHGRRLADLYDRENIIWRYGDTAYDIYGNTITDTPGLYPLFIKNESLKAYNHLMESLPVYCDPKNDPAALKNHKPKERTS